MSGGSGMTALKRARSLPPHAWEECLPHPGLVPHPGTCLGQCGTSGPDTKLKTRLCSGFHSLPAVHMRRACGTGIQSHAGDGRRGSLK